MVYRRRNARRRRRTYRRRTSRRAGRRGWARRARSGRRKNFSRRRKGYKGIPQFYPKVFRVKQKWHYDTSFGNAVSTLTSGVPTAYASNYRVNVTLPYDPIDATGTGQPSASWTVFLNRIYAKMVVDVCKVTYVFKQINLAPVPTTPTGVRRYPVMFALQLSDRNIVPTMSTYQQVEQDPSCVWKRTWASCNTDVPMANCKLTITYIRRKMWPSGSEDDNAVYLNAPGLNQAVVVPYICYVGGVSTLDPGPTYQISMYATYYSHWYEKKDIVNMPDDAEILQV